MEEKALEKALKRTRRNHEEVEKISQKIINRLKQELADKNQIIRSYQRRERRVLLQNFDVSMISPEASKTVKVFPNVNQTGTISAEFPPLLAAKDSKTFLIGGEISSRTAQNRGRTVRRRGREWRKAQYFFKLFKNKQHLTTFGFSLTESVQGAFYVKSLNCFYFMLNGMLYSKSLSKKEAQICFRCPYLAPRGCFLKYSDMKDRLVILDSERVSILNLYTKRLEVSYPHWIKRTIADCSLYGDQEGHMMILTYSGDIYTLNYERLGSLRRLRIADVHKKVIPSCLSVSTDNRFVCVAAKDKAEWTLGGEEKISKKSCFLVFEIFGRRLRLSAACDFERNSLSRFSTICFFKQFGSCYVFVGFAESTQNDIFTAVFSSALRSIKELRQKRERSAQADPIRVAKVGEKFLMVGKTLKMNKLTLMD